MKIRTKQKIDNLLGKFLVALHLPIVKILGKLLRINHELANPPKEIFIIKLLGFGSLILGADAILALKNKYPLAKITLICGSGLAEGAKLMKLFDNILIIDDNNFFSMFKSSIKTSYYCLRSINSWCFDFEVYSRLTTIFSLYTFSKNRFGFEFEKVNFRNYLNTHNIYFNHFIPTEENYNEMSLKANAKIIDRYQLPFVSKNISKNIIIINNSCSSLSLQRKLDQSQLEELINTLIKQTNYNIALIGSPSDAADNENTIAQVIKKDRIENWAGKYSFEKLLQMQVDSAIAIVSIDSAPLHIAARLAIPLVAIWGPTQSQSLAPKWLIESKNYKEINHKVHCSPCVHHTKELPCKGNNFCIKNIKTNEIIAAVKTLIDERV